jgi:serine/threonine protein phosphatase 1
MSGHRYVIGDIHGCLKTFRYMVEEIIRLERDDTLFLLGDYVDRGPESRGVIDFIITLREKGYPIVTLMGNHEDMLLSAMEGGAQFNQWMRNGAPFTLRSFGMEKTIETGYAFGFRLPDPYLNFLHDLKFYVETDDVILVHAGIDLSLPDPFSETFILLWTRQTVIEKKVLGNRKVIHGHTPVPLTVIREMVDDPEADDINIDGGCVYTMYRSLGYLAALDLDKWELMWVKNLEDLK